MSVAKLRALEAAGEAVGQGLPATGADVAAVAGPLLVHATRLPPDQVLRAGFIWPVLQHAAWVWRLSDGSPTMAYALAIQVRTDALHAIETALEATALAFAGAPAGRALPRVQAALRAADPDADGGARLPPALPADAVLPLAIRRFGSVEAVPGDLFVLSQLFTATTFARVDGFTRREVVDAFVSILDDLGPVIASQLSQAAA